MADQKKPKHSPERHITSKRYKLLPYIPLIYILRVEFDYSIRKLADVLHVSTNTVLGVTHHEEYLSYVEKENTDTYEARLLTEFVKLGVDLTDLVHK